ncbi:hypothetical protein DSL92_04520 [Billgrantia gudaonensis]|uniref:ComEC/Rec2-related protein domain-containing protein n=1 Tax=Billgrantia gudaonensis TaxID=376427 RepID=A0A3S0NX33_9GAMM|nr:hypothetical protein DSL92_04520 [Halomonas gudaonensis]
MGPSQCQRHHSPDGDFRTPCGTGGHRRVADGARNRTECSRQGRWRLAVWPGGWPERLPSVMPLWPEWMPALRAMLMTLVGLWVASGRHAPGLAGLVVGAGGAVRPLAAWRPGLWLSFLAVALLIPFQGATTARRSERLGLGLGSEYASAGATDGCSRAVHFARMAPAAAESICWRALVSTLMDLGVGRLVCCCPSAAVEPVLAELRLFGAGVGSPAGDGRRLAAAGKPEPRNMPLKLCWGPPCWALPGFAVSLRCLGSLAAQRDLSSAWRGARPYRPACCGREFAGR